MGKTMISASSPSASMAVLDEGVAQGTQDVVAFRIVSAAGQVFRFTARSDTYDEQCYAKIEHWNPVQGGWSLLHALPPGLMKTPAKLKYNHQGLRWAYFEDDFARLFKTAQAVTAASRDISAIMASDALPAKDGPSRPRPR